LGSSFMANSLFLVSLCLNNFGKLTDARHFFAACKKAP